MQPTQMTAVTATPAKAEAGAATQTAVANGRTWSILPESNVSTGTAMLQIFAGIVGILLFAGWVTGAVFIAKFHKTHGESSRETKLMIGQILLGVCLPMWCCGVGGAIGYKAKKHV